MVEKIIINPNKVRGYGNIMSPHSSSDYELLNYVNSNSKYKSMSFMIINDDNVRENGNLIKASQILEFSNSNNWNIISMKNEWKTIYGFDVNKNV